MASISSPDRRSKPLANGLTAEVFEAIKKKILDVEAQPGTRLVIDRLVQELGVSSSPVREALARLLAERLVLFKPNSGYIVADLPDRHYFADLIEFRLLLECQAVRIGAPQCDLEILKQLHEAIWEMERLPLGRSYDQFQQFSHWDAKFHLALVASAGNRVMIQCYSDLKSHMQLSRLYRHQRIQVEKEDVLRDHKAISKAFDAGDSEAAATTVLEHIEHTRIMLEYEVEATPKNGPEMAASVPNVARIDAAEDTKCSYRKKGESRVRVD